MNQITTTEDIRRLGNIMSIWAHPDDETLACGGIMAAAVRNGQEVVCVTATKGEAGVQDEKRWPPAQLGTIREKELHDALDILGVTRHHWLDYFDGKLTEVTAANALIKIHTLIDQYRPDTILTFGPDGITGHPDHATVSDWVSQVTAMLSDPPRVYHVVERRDIYEKYMIDADAKFNIYFNIDEPPLCEPEDCDIYFTLGKDLCALKRQALVAQPSQYEKMLEYYTPDIFDEIFCAEAFVRAPSPK